MVSHARAQFGETVRPLRAGALDHIPGERGWPLIGNTLEALADLRAYTRRMYETYGPVYRHNVFFIEQLALIGPEANAFFFLDRERALSSEAGWMPYLESLFPRGLMLLDFEHHRADRKIMAAAFKAPAMRRYLARLDAAIPGRIRAWGERGRFRFYDAIKTLTLEMASEVFLGLAPGETTARVNRALADMVAASVALLRRPLPGTAYARGIRGRRVVEAFLESEIPARRTRRGDDMFTLLCQAADETGNRFDDRQIVDHMAFLWMAAHDTITSSMSTLVYELGRHPDWQERLHDECASLGRDHLEHDDLGRLTLVDCAFKEALRLNAPVPAIPRMAVKDVDFGGYRIPAGTTIGVSPTFVHHMPDIWPEPARFDPLRFTEAGGVRERPKYAWVPFGGGAHMCIGLHFATMQAKAVIFHLLRDYRIRLDGPAYRTEFRIMPLTRPKDGLPLRLERR